MRGVLAPALARLRRRRGRALLAAGGIAAASAMLGAAVTVSFSLATGFDRAAERAHLPDAVARFAPLSRDEIGARARALPNVAAVSYRVEEKGVPLAGDDDRFEYARVQRVLPGPRGYAVVEGRDVARAGEVVVERGLAREWATGPGDTVTLGGEELAIVGVAVEPDNVAYPLTAGPRVYVPYGGQTVNVAQLWVRDPDRLDVTLAQARAASFGVESLQFVTRSGIRALIGEAAGIVIALLVAFSLVALAAAGVMLAASSAAEVQRRVQAIGVVRALGASAGQVTAGAAVEGALVAAPAGALGLAAGTAVVLGPTERLLEALNELAPGVALLLPLAACLVGVVLVVALASAWPAWRAARRRPAETLRGSDVTGTPRRIPFPAGAAGLGMRLVLARPLRTGATVVVLAASASVVLLMLTLASLLERLEQDPETVGKRYRLTVSAPAEAVPRIDRVPGVASAAARYELAAADSFELGETFRIVAFEGDHTRFEAPPLADGRRVDADDEVEVGLGLAQALNLHLGSTLAAQLAAGGEVRLRVIGVVRALEDEGRVAYARPARLLAAAPSLEPEIAVLLEREARKDDVADALRVAGFFPA
ncbi:MAG: FtsX-like permease family protein, partial [Thermoleophilia bacterium]|nr:FtsX-like permease family protein [Thermoleophilia bacterium]